VGEQQIPPLRYGMEMQKGNSKCNSNDNSRSSRFAEG